MTKTSKQQRRARRNANVTGGVVKSGNQGYKRPPALVPTISKRHTFRYLNGGTSVVTTFTADQISEILVAATSGSTAAIGLITSWKLRKVTLHHAVVGNASTGFVVSPTLYWEAGSGALTEEGKASSVVGVSSYQDVGGKIVLTPPAKSNLGFWFNDSSSGNLFTVNMPSNIGSVLDIELDVTLADAVTPGRAVTLGAAAGGTGFLQRGYTSWTPVGYSAYTP